MRPDNAEDRGRPAQRLRDLGKHRVPIAEAGGCVIHMVDQRVEQLMVVRHGALPNQPGGTWKQTRGRPRHDQCFNALRESRR